jgi:hypothetical protein
MPRGGTGMSRPPIHGPQSLHEPRGAARNCQLVRHPAWGRVRASRSRSQEFARAVELGLAREPDQGHPERESGQEPEHGRAPASPRVLPRAI